MATAKTTTTRFDHAAIAAKWQARWEGWHVHGWPVTTVLRGKVMVEDRQLVGAPDDGKLVERRIAMEATRRPVS